MKRRAPTMRHCLACDKLFPAWDDQARYCAACFRARVDALLTTSIRPRKTNTTEG